MLQEEIGGLTFHTTHEQASFGSETCADWNNKVCQYEFLCRKENCPLTDIFLIIYLYLWRVWVWAWAISYRYSCSSISGFSYSRLPETLVQHRKIQALFASRSKWRSSWKFEESRWIGAGQNTAEWNSMGDAFLINHSLHNEIMSARFQQNSVF